HLVWIEVLAGVVHQRFRLRFEDSRPYALTNERALPIAAVGIEPVANDRLAVSNDIGHDRDQAQGHLGKVDVRVSDWRRNRLRHFANVHDTDRWRYSGARSRYGSRMVKHARSPSRVTVSCRRR